MRNRWLLVAFVLAMMSSLCCAARCVSAEPEAKKFDPLTTWEQALGEYEPACQLLVDGKLTEATKKLDRLIAELPQPYSLLAGRAAERVEGIARAAVQDKAVVPGKAAVQNKAAVNDKAARDFEAAKRLAALSWICESLGCDEQSDALAAGANAATDKWLDLPPIRGSSRIRTLSQLRAEKAAATTPKLRLRFGIQVTRTCGALKDEKGQRAWVEKLTVDFPDDEQLQFLDTFKKVRQATEKHDIDAAIALWQRLMDRFPNSIAGLVAESSRNQLWLKSGRRDNAIEAAKELLEHADRLVDDTTRRSARELDYCGISTAAASLWKHYESTGQLEDALKYARLTIKFSAGEPRCGNDEGPRWVRLDLADLLRRVGQCDEALAIATSLAEPSWTFDSKSMSVTRARALVKKIRAEFPNVKEPAPEQRQAAD